LLRIQQVKDYGTDVKFNFVGCLNFKAADDSDDVLDGVVK
jgi:hypothetical protein